MMRLLAIEVQTEQDVVFVRQRARQVAALLAFDPQDQIRIATAVSEITRNAFQFARGGKVEFLLDGPAEELLQIRVSDNGPGIADVKGVLDGRIQSQSGGAGGIVGARRLMDEFQILSESGRGTTVSLSKRIPDRGTRIATKLPQIVDELARSVPETPFEEFRRQNQDLMSALGELRAKQAELIELNGELMETNRGIVALYAELDEKAESLRSASEMKSRFLSNISHEFRTPLNSILGISQFLIDRADGDLEPEQEKQVTLIRKSARALLEMVNDLLDLAKVEAGRVAVDIQDVSVTDLFGALRGMFRPLMTRPEVTLVFEPPSELHQFRSDEGKIAQILRNFISNAVKFTESGEIRVSASVRNDESIVFAVKDSGIGILPEDLERIFEEFVQVEGHIQKRIKGTGLGLPLSRKFAELLGGCVWVESGMGVGSTFHLSLPLEHSGSDAVRPPVVPEPNAWRLPSRREPSAETPDSISLRGSERDG